MFKRNNDGFTLIELMIVVIIIGILASIAIPNFISMQDRDNTMIIGEDINEGVQKYVQVHGELPTIEQLMGAGGKLQNAYSGGFTEPRYAYSNPPTNPVEGGIYYYLKSDSYAIIIYSHKTDKPLQIYDYLN